MAERKVKPSSSGSKEESNSKNVKKAPAKANNIKKSNSSKKITEPKNENNQFWSIILFALGVLTALMTIIEGSSGWRAIHNFLLGMFGIAVIAVPVILI